MVVAGTSVRDYYDFTNEPTAPGLPEPVPVLLSREKWRGRLAMGFLALLAAAVILVLVLDVEENAVDKVVTPLFTLIASVVGFYFGRASASGE